MTRLLLLAVALFGICEAFSPSMYSAQSVSQRVAVALTVRRCGNTYLCRDELRENRSLKAAFINGVYVKFFQIPLCRRTKQYYLAGTTAAEYRKCMLICSKLGRLEPAFTKAWTKTPFGLEGKDDKKFFLSL